MTHDRRVELDATDEKLLAELQRDGRTSIADLGRAVAMSPSATSDRLRRLVDAGVVTGWTVTLCPEALGYAITAFVRLAYPAGNAKPLLDLVEATPEVVEAHHVTGDDCYVFKVLARDMRDLERITGRLSGLGSTTTSVVYSSPLVRRAIGPA